MTGSSISLRKATTFRSASRENCLPTSCHVHWRRSIGWFAPHRNTSKATVCQRRRTTSSGHNCLVYTHANPDSQWRFRAGDEEIVVPVRGNLRLNDDEALWQSVLGGLGISLLPTFIVGEDLQSGQSATGIDAIRCV